jgi:cell division protein FtsQ
MKKWFSNTKNPFTGTWFSRGRKAILLLSLSTVFVVLMGFVESEQSEKTIQNIYVHIDYDHDNYFIGKEEVLSLMTHHGEEIIIGQIVDNIRLKELEERIETHNFVEDAQVFKDHKGFLTVKITQRRPLARVIDQKGPDAYIDDKGKCIPSSERFTARVMLIDGSYSRNLKKENFLSSEKGKEYFDLITYINQNSFWKAQLAQMTIEANGDVIFHPQIGDEIIEFGKPEEIEAKFRKLKVFYKKIYPFKGFNHYDKISLNFKDQIICE